MGAFTKLVPTIAITLAAMAPAMAQRSQPAVIDEMVARVVVLTNQERTSRGLCPLRIHRNLNASSAWMAQSMGQGNYFSHVDTLGRNIDSRLPASGYTAYSAIGENIAAGQFSAAEVMAAWMASPGHRANILNPSYREIGVACAYCPKSRSQVYWVEDFGARFGAEEVSSVEDPGTRPSAQEISSVAPRASCQTMQVSICGVDGADSMRFSVDARTWSSWRPFNSKTTYPVAAGRNTVYCQVRTGKSVRAAEAWISLVPARPDQLALAE